MVEYTGRYGYLRADDGVTHRVDWLSPPSKRPPVLTPATKCGVPAPADQVVVGALSVYRAAGGGRGVIRHCGECGDIHDAEFLAHLKKLGARAETCRHNYSPFDSCPVCG